jgi:hypothetical protein
VQEAGVLPEQAYGAAAADNPEGRRPTMRGFKIAHGKVGQKLRAARRRVAALLRERRALPQRVEPRDVSPGAVVKLHTERRHPSNILKMVAYQAESDLPAQVRPHDARAGEEGRTLLHEIFAACADIAVAGEELRVTLVPLSSPHRTAAAQALCELLNETSTTLPGSRLRMRFAVHAPRRLGPAFPGSAPARPPVRAP